MHKFLDYFRSFARDEDGAQIIEYALLVAVVSLVLIGLISTQLAGDGGGFTTWLTNVSNCLSDGSTCGVAAAPPAAP
jgi:pilus assembly protein Flp/PilA